MANRAAWLKEAKQKPFAIGDAPMPTPEPHEVVIRLKAVAINPVDAYVQQLGIIVQDYPTIIGSDGAGEIAAVGSDVKHLSVGDRVVGYCDAWDSHKPTNGAYQYYAATAARVVSKLPDSVTFSQAAVLPLALSTSGVGLFDKDHLALSYPQIDPKPNGKLVLVWGGSSSVGSCAIQLSQAAGYEVAAITSSRNAQYCKDLGASYTFEYTTPVEEIVKELSGKQCAGSYCASQTPADIVKSAQIIEKLGGQHVATVAAPGTAMPDEMPAGVKGSTFWGSFITSKDSGDAIYTSYLYRALENGSFKCKPDARIVGKGLEAFQPACDEMLKGVSASKLVVEL
ncbi:uncharacterized protein L969DRAFT_54202 [Mixia osmundae IAM 14324]|uniref:Enoyl reductase (ER) domain-containing protein n=1 Tax=Mixia osmundae (strain CBS 9802 / IAM 14324 / JCM 22182 / KY 12970) TaxID=764103 RepID=G7E262_MIXOS|nr:uncharacterized protein L969DRAFT_54202 [Mixia osmundae IAM 14324]KEI36794.1 hypothetical protein L969DRAFT_54202 [Mixia osmundae IAM 14324]GAA96922.1 hypothetical protein E5Q_03596 [Mixia osmundae IAM 14324]